MPIYTEDTLHMLQNQQHLAELQRSPLLKREPVLYEKKTIRKLTDAEWEQSKNGFVRLTLV